MSFISTYLPPSLPSFLPPSLPPFNSTSIFLTAYHSTLFILPPFHPLHTLHRSYIPLPHSSSSFLCLFLSFHFSVSIFLFLSLSFSLSLYLSFQSLSLSLSFSLSLPLYPHFILNLPWLRSPRHPIVVDPRVSSVWVDRCRSRQLQSKSCAKFHTQKMMR